LNISGRIRAVRAVGGSDRRFPKIVWVRERLGNRVEGVLEEWVRHRGHLAIGCDDIDGLHKNDFGRRDTIPRPVPVWHSQFPGCVNPELLIDLVRVCDIQSVLLQDFLDDLTHIIIVYARHELVS
jgi:hypothetical protein